MNNKKTSFYTLLIFIFLPNLLIAINEKQVAQNVLNDIFETTGNFLFLKPLIEISADKKNVAYFKPRSNVIVIEKTVFSLCRKMGRDSVDALAYIIGHELAHSFQNEIKKHGHDTNFLSYSEHMHSTERLEKSADIQGVFGAFLAGYQVRNIVPKILKLVYEEYGLMGKALPNYPSFDVRLQTAEEVIDKVEELINLYEAANFMTSLNEHQYASSAYSYIEQYYQGSEIYQNIGVNLALHAINFSDKNIDTYLLPLEISWESRLQKEFGKLGSKDLSPDELRYREKYLIKAQNAFEKAIQLNFDCHPCYLNIVMTKILRGDYAGAIQYFHDQELDKRAAIFGSKKLESEKAKLTLGIAYAYSPIQKSKGIEIFKELKNSSNTEIAYMADYNLSIAESFSIFDDVSVSNNPICVVPFDVKSVDEVRLHRCGHLTDFRINDDINHNAFIDHKANSVLLNFSGDDHNFTMQLIKKKAGKIDLANFQGDLLHLTNIENGFLLACEEKKIIMRLDTKGNILEWAKYFRQ